MPNRIFTLARLPAALVLLARTRADLPLTLVLLARTAMVLSAALIWLAQSHRRRLAVVVVLGCASMPVLAQTPIKVLSGFPPGGAVDILARVFAERLAEGAGRPTLVDNRTGAGGLIAVEALRAAAPDGATLLVAPDANITVYPHTVRKPTYDPRTDMVAVAYLGHYDIGFGVGPAFPSGDLKAYLAWAKADPLHANYGSAGAGSTLHFVGLMLAQASTVELTHVPYRGVGPALTDVTAGQIPAVALPLGTMVAQSRAGKMRILAHTGTRRSVVSPDIPTFAEQGFPGLQIDGWFGLFAPAGTSAVLVNRYNDIIMKSIRTQAVGERLRALDLDSREYSATEFAAVVASDFERWGPIIRASGFTADSQ